MGIAFNAHGSVILKVINDFANVSEDTVKLTKAINVMVNSLFLIPIDKRSRLIMIYRKAFFNGFGIVIRASALLTAPYQTLHQFLFGDVKFNHCRYFVSALSQHLLQSFGLRNGTWEAIEDNALVFFAEAIINTGKDINHQLVRNQLAVINISLGSLAKFCPFPDLITKHITRRNVLETIL